jgi:hypothetical protein
MTTSPETLALLGRAAKIRAEGKSWADAAAQLAVGADELRRLAADHSRDYDRLARRARTEALREGMDEAVATLRRLLLSEDPDVSRMSALTLVRYTLARMRKGLDVGGDALARKPRKITVQAENVRAENVSESAEVAKRQTVDAAKKVAQPQQPATRVPPPPAPATPPAPPAPARPATPPPAAAQPSEAEKLRRKRLLDAAVLGHPGPRTPITKGGSQTLEADRLMSGWLADGK